MANGMVLHLKVSNSNRMSARVEFVSTNCYKFYENGLLDRLTDMDPGFHMLQTIWPSQLQV